MYVNVKMISAETIPEMQGGMIKETDGGDEFMYDTFDTL
jgi:hypothetical protein